MTGDPARDNRSLLDPREEGAGWARPSQILRPNYGFTLGSGYATYLTNPTTAQCQKLLGFSRRGVSLALLCSYSSDYQTGCTRNQQTSQANTLKAARYMVRSLFVQKYRKIRWITSIRLMKTPIVPTANPSTLDNLLSLKVA